ncbi:unnamed protein product [Cylicostephanus goldi]|uniref:Uncharacterized protein n=1 Tax=Cylicostephanus goldi TaxID=71465 RepID=A0A3P6R8Y3_CYLGO|nr:unnamed protein product [Cylicostephanus goldi]
MNQLSFRVHSCKKFLVQDDEDDVFCDDYGYLAEDDLASERFEHTRQVNAEKIDNEPCRLEDILNRLSESRQEIEDNAGIAFQEGDIGAGDLQTHSDESDEKEVMAQNDKLLSRKCVLGDYGLKRYFETGDIVEGSTYHVVRVLIATCANDIIVNILQRGPILVSTNRAPYAYKLVGLL